MAKASNGRKRSYEFSRASPSPTFRSFPSSPWPKTRYKNIHEWPFDREDRTEPRKTIYQINRLRFEFDRFDPPARCSIYIFTDDRLRGGRKTWETRGKIACWPRGERGSGKQKRGKKRRRNPVVILAVYTVCTGHGSAYGRNSLSN